MHTDGEKNSQMMRLDELQNQVYSSLPRNFLRREIKARGSYRDTTKKRKCEKVPKW